MFYSTLSFYLDKKKMKALEKIESLLEIFSENEKDEIFAELQGKSFNSESVASFAQYHQKKYGKNISFQIKKTGVDHSPVITAILTTDFGEFEAEGTNQKIAKANAIAKAKSLMSKFERPD